MKLITTVLQPAGKVVVRMYCFPSQEEPTHGVQYTRLDFVLARSHLARIRAYLSTCCSPSAIHGPNFVRLRGSSWATLWPRALILWIKFATLRVSRISACRSVLVDGNSEFGTLLSGSASSTCATHEKIPLQLEIWAQRSSNGCSLGLPMALLLKAQLRKAHDLPL